MVQSGNFFQLRPINDVDATIGQADKPDTWPAQPDPRWHIQLDRASLIGIFTGNINPNTRRSEGGFYPTRIIIISARSLICALARWRYCAPKHQQRRARGAEKG